MAGEDFESISPAATVLLLRDRPAFEVLMIARHERSAFAGGALVFPGGRVDASDSSKDWRAHARGLAEDAVMAAAQVAAIREAFEEAGVLLALDETGGPVDGDRQRALSGRRSEVERDDAQFLAMIRAERLTLDCSALHLFSHWVAPPGLHRRFDTLFFAARFPEGQAVLEDGNEATEALWVAPAAAMAAREAGARKIIFPTARNLELLGVSASSEDVFTFAAGRNIPPVTPVPVNRGGAVFLTIPEGLGYPVTDEPIEKSGRF